MTDTTRQRFTADMYDAEAEGWAEAAYLSPDARQQIVAMLQHAADLAREREQRFKLGQDWVTRTTNAAGDDVSVVGPMSTALPSQSAALCARLRDVAQRAYELSELEASDDERVTIQSEARDIRDAADRLERAETLVAQVRAWAEEPERNLGFREAQQEVLAMMRRGEGK